MRRIRKRGRVVEGSSLENCRRCEPFVSSNLTASSGGFFVSASCWSTAPTVTQATSSEMADGGTLCFPRLLGDMPKN
jgi:hypothetical protein